MKNTDKFRQVFGLYATEVWAMPEKEFLQWLNASAESERKKGKWIWQTENRYVCSECGHHTQVDELFEEPMYAFCPYCSTSMLDEDGNVRYER